ncbi:MAG: hypothetical protein HY717_17255 [Planctomycetes bacterium]|nr:hypothetical protein [Planctomycetota bacterium]
MRRSRIPIVLRLRTAFSGGLLAALLSSCAREVKEEGPFSGLDQVLSFPVDRDKALIHRGTFHGVSFLVEQENLQEGQEAAPVLLQHARQKEIYLFGDGLEVEYQNSFFFVDSIRFPSEPNSYIHIFKGLEGRWAFNYRGQRIALERPGRWRPAVYRRIVEVSEPASEEFQTRRARQRGKSSETKSKSIATLEFEELRFFTSIIVFRPGEPYWELNGQRFLPIPDKILVVDHRRNFKVVSSVEGE